MLFICKTALLQCVNCIENNLMGCATSYNVFMCGQINCCWKRLSLEQVWCLYLRQMCLKCHYLHVHMSHEHSKVGQVCAGAGGVCSVGSQQPAVLRGPEARHTALRVAPEWTVGVEILLWLLKEEEQQTAWEREWAEHTTCAITRVTLKMNLLQHLSTPPELLFYWSWNCRMDEDVIGWLDEPHKHTPVSWNKF